MAIVHRGLDQVIAQNNDQGSGGGKGKANKKGHVKSHNKSLLCAMVSQLEMKPVTPLSS